MGVGFHPYFTLDSCPIDTWEASFPATKYLEFQNLVPTGRVLNVEGSPLDYREQKPIGANKFNFCFCDLEREADGSAVAMLRNSNRAIKLTFDSAFNYLVVYSGEAIPAPDTRKAFAIEPITCATDAFNHPEWGLKILNPRESFTGSYRIEPVLFT
ncbi:MAG: hypothetical protein HC902_14665 [Calothrix sp. SM1_5_4]|nr:hypothetical protein [Calothrix sp. SM1_5_4]